MLAEVSRAVSPLRYKELTGSFSQATDNPTFEFYPPKGNGLQFYSKFLHGEPSLEAERRAPKLTSLFIDVSSSISSEFESEHKLTHRSLGPQLEPVPHHLPPSRWNRLCRRQRELSALGPLLSRAL